MPDMRREDLVARLRRLQPKLASEGVASMGLFGSRARRDNQPGSDIDLVIEVMPNRKFSLFDLAAVAQTVEDDTGLPANIFMRRSLEREFIESLQKDEVKVF